MKHKRTILILGASLMQLPAIRSAKQLGLFTSVCDGNPQARYAKEADAFFTIDLKNKEGIAEKAKEIKTERGLHAVFTAGTDFSASVAWVAQELGLPGIPYSAAVNASDKSKMRAVFKQHQVPSPDFRQAGSVLESVKAAQAIGFPVVVKPVDNMGSRGVQKAANKEELKTAAETALQYSRTSKIIIESFMEGKEFSIDALVWNDSVYFCGIADRHIFFTPYFVEMGHTMPSNAQPWEIEAVKEVFIRGVRALGINQGAAKGDMKLTTQGVKVGEIAARLSGGYMSGWTYPYSTGVELTKAAIRIALGEEPKNLTPKYSKTSAERAVISAPGKIAAIYGLSDAKRGIKEFFLRVGPKDTVVFPTNNVEKCANAISCHASGSRAIALAETACRKLILRLAPDNIETKEFFLNPPAYPGPAFAVLCPENRTQLEHMPQKYSIQFDPKREKRLTFAYSPMPGLKQEESRDWQGRSILEALRCLYRFHVFTNPSKACILLGSDFWKAFFNGSVQGGLWYLDWVLLQIQEQANAFKI